MSVTQRWTFYLSEADCECHPELNLFDSCEADCECHPELNLFDSCEADCECHP